MITTRRSFLAGGAALAAAPAILRAQTAVVTPEQFGAAGDLRGDGGTDDTPAFRRMAAYLDATGATARITRRHRLNGAFALHAGALEFADGALVRNTSRGRGIWRDTCLFVGTVFGGGPTTAGGINSLPELAVLPLAAGSDRLRFADGRVPPGFAPGTLVYVKDGRRYPGAGMDFRVASHVSEVVAVDRDAVILRHPAPRAVGGGATAITIPRRGIALDPRFGVPAQSGRLARGVRIVNGAFESAQTAPAQAQTVHVACHASDLDFRWLAGSACLGINPCSDSRIAVRDAEFTDVLYELAMFHARVRGETIRGRRVGRENARGVSPVTISEYGHSVDLGLVEVTDAPGPGDANRPTVSIVTPLTRIDTLRVANAGPVAVLIGAAGTRAEGTRIGSLEIAGGMRFGVWVESDDVEIGALSVAGLRADGAVPVRIGREVGRNLRIGATRFAPGQAVQDQRR